METENEVDCMKSKALVAYEANMQLVPTFKDSKTKVRIQQNVLEEDVYLEV